MDFYVSCGNLRCGWRLFVVLVHPCAYECIWAMSQIGRGRHTFDFWLYKNRVSSDSAVDMNSVTCSNLGSAHVRAIVQTGALITTSSGLCQDHVKFGIVLFSGKLARPWIVPTVEVVFQRVSCVGTIAVVRGNVSSSLQDHGQYFVAIGRRKLTVSIGVSTNLVRIFFAWPAATCRLAPVGCHQSPLPRWWSRRWAQVFCFPCRLCGKTPP